MTGNLNLSLTRLSTVYFLADFAFNKKEKYISIEAGSYDYYFNLVCLRTSKG